MYYKVVSDGMIVDALNVLEYCRYVEKVKRVLRCKEDEDPCGIISWQGIIWHVDGWPEFPEGTEDIAGTVTYSEIDEEEYTALYAAIQSGIEVEEEEEPEPEQTEEDQSSLEYIRAAKITEMSKASEAAMDAGFTVILSDGLQHLFTLTIADHAQLNSLAIRLLSGAEEFTYHASGEPCKFYSAQDMSIIIKAATELKTYHETYNNALKLWIQDMTTIAEISAVTYGIEIPEEYQNEVLQKYGTSMRTTTEIDSETEATEE